MQQNKTAIITLAMMGLIYNTPGYAQDSASQRTDDVVEESKDIDLAEVKKAFDPFFANDNPTFSMLGVKDSDIQAPGTPAELAGGILNGMDQNGNFQQGFALEFVPAQIFGGRALTVAKYRNEMNWLERSLARLQFGVGVARGTNNNDQALRAVAGFVWQPINGLDPLKNGTRYICVDSLREQFRINTGGTSPGSAARSALEKKLLKDVEECRKSNPVQLDNTVSVQFSAATLFNSDMGNIGDLKLNGFALNTNVSIGLSGKSQIEQTDNWRDAKESRGRLILTTGYRDGELVPDPDNNGSFLNRNRFYAGGRLAWGVPQKFEFGLEGVYQSSNYSNNLKDSYATVVGSVDYRLSEQLWLGLSLGSSIGSSVIADSTFIGTTFKFAFDQK